jgi:hypothetical protein
VGLAVIGSISVARATREWHAYLDTLPAAAGATAAALVQQVAGGEAQVVAAALGHEAAAPALSAFLSGYRGAMVVAAGLLFVAAVIALAGLGTARRSPIGE